MPSLAEIFRETGGYKIAKYLQIYETLFGARRRESLGLLELGIYKGGSLQGWAAYFPNAVIAGIDLELPSIPPHNRIHMYAAAQANPAALSRVAAEVAPDGFDIIIDDCSHLAKPTKAAFWHLFDNHLKPGGIYCIEDWATGYWAWWPDGRSIVPEPDTERRMPSHDAGMVGFLKQLIDEFHPGISDATPEALAAALAEMQSGSGQEIGQGTSKFASMALYPGICVITKAERR